MKLLHSGGHFFEGPRWYNGHWYVSDLYAHTVSKISPDGKQVEVVAEIPHQPSGLGWMPDGSMLVVSMQDKKVFRLPVSGALEEHADLAGVVKGYINDMVVDAQGNAYVGSFGFDLFEGDSPAPARIIRVAADGQISVAAEDVLFPNGMVIADGGKTLIVAETFAARMSAFAIGADGSLSDRRIWCEMGPLPSWETLQSMMNVAFAPDGCTLDAEGGVWVADALYQRVSRIVDGQIVETIQSPEGLGLYSCALGGEDGKTLLMCMAPDFDHVARAERNEGALYTCDVAVPRAE